MAEAQCKGKSGLCLKDFGKLGTFILQIFIQQTVNSSAFSKI